MSTSSDVENHIFYLSPEELVLDRDNPRLLPEEYSGIELATEEEIIRALAQYDLNELLQSIAENGYLNIEPLYIQKIGHNKYKVLEGNRRLAAIKLLRNNELARKCGINLPKIERHILATTDKILVHEAQNEKDGLAYIGFKHINGPHKWDSIAKARFVLNLYKKNYPIDQISKMIGDTHNTIQKMLIGMTVLEQASEEGIFYIEDRHSSLKVFPFSHLYTALTRKEYQQYLGLQKNILKNPVPKENLPRLEKVLHWIYGSKSDDIRPVIKSQNPDIKNLGTVLSHSRALAVLESRNDLDEAIKQTIPPGIALKDSLVAALFNAKEALGYSSDVVNIDEDTQDLALQLKKTTESVYQLLIKEDTNANQNKILEVLINQLKENPSILNSIFNK